MEESRGVGAGAGSTGWDRYGVRSVQASRKLVTKIVEKSLLIITVVSKWDKYFRFLEEKSQKLHKV